MGIDYTHKKYGGEWGGNLISRPGKFKIKETTKGPQTGQTKIIHGREHGMVKESGAPGTNRKLHVKSSKRLNEIMRLKEKKRQTRTGPGTEKARKKRLSHLQKGGYKTGGRAGFKHGKWVKEPTPHADIKKYVDRGTGKEDTRGKRVRKEGSTMEFKKPKQSRGSSPIREAARAGYRGGGRTNLLEELGRVEGEHSNRNRRAEVSRIHGELNKGYKSGGAVLKGKKSVFK